MAGGELGGVVESEAGEAGGSPDRELVGEEELEGDLEREVCEESISPEGGVPDIACVVCKYLVWEGSGVLIRMTAVEIDPNPCVGTARASNDNLKLGICQG